MTYEDELKKLQTEMTAKLEQDMVVGAATRRRSTLQVQKGYFLMGIIRARQSQHLSQLQLASKAGMQQSAVARIESGRGNPSLRTLLKIAQALDTNLSM